MGTTVLGKGARATRAGKLIAGARKHFANGTQVLTFAGALANVTVDQAVAELQELVDNRAKAVAARAAAKDAVQAERAATPVLVAFMNAFEALVRLMFGADTAALADFGLTPHKAPARQTAEEKAVAAVKRKATREARGTTGTKAKKATHGNVTAKLVVTPVTPAPAAAPEAPAPANAPAAAPGGAPGVQPKG
jgi:type I site-specific restriction endonuclease